MDATEVVNECPTATTQMIDSVGAQNFTYWAEDMDHQCLPRDVRPISYHLYLEPDLDELDFKGDETIQIEVVKETNVITLNSIELVLKVIRITSIDGKVDMFPKECQYWKEEEAASLFFEKPLAIGMYKLHINYVGTLNNKMKGFYRCKYMGSNGKMRYAGVTQFEATNARRCFPCWDEPDLKAVFDIEVLVPKDRIALSNMPVIQETVVDDKICVKFDRSPLMSTYLVAIVVGEFDYVEGKSDDGVLVRVYTPIGKKEQGVFALEVATKVLPYYKSYFDIAYPLPKMDLIAITDFSAGAMENWGLITYRETSVLVDPENTSLMRKQSIALTVGHEIAHQWFGNLVTMEWWTHLWLNEGYASFVEFLCVHHLFPEYDIWTQFVSDMYTRALELDSLENSHAIEVPVNHPCEIEEIFDEISYNKGACIIRMLHDYIGEDDFRKGMHLYLSRYQYGNTKTEDLWNSLKDASSKPVTKVMSSWTKLKGFPLITVNHKETKNGKCVLEISQKKFVADGSSPTEQQLWVVPINIATSTKPNGIEESFLLETESMEVTINYDENTKWIKINPGTIGYYRTKYSSDMLENLITAVRNMELSPLDRLGLIDDMFALVQAGEATTAQGLSLIDSYRNETNYTVWIAITNVLDRLHILMSHTNLMDDFHRYCVNLYSPVAKRLGWDNLKDEHHLDTLLRSLVLSRLVTYGCVETINEGKRRFRDHINKSTIISADLRSTCYRAILKYGDVDTYEQMLSMYRVTDLHEEQDRISRSMGSIEDPALLAKVIDFAMSVEVRAQDSVFVIVGVALNPNGRDIAWQFFKDNHEKLNQQYEGNYLLARLIKYIIENFASEESAQEVENFFKTRKLPGTERAVLQAVETVRLNAAWLNRDLNLLTDYLKNQN